MRGGSIITGKKEKEIVMITTGGKIGDKRLICDGEGWRHKPQMIGVDTYGKRRTSGVE